MDTKLLGYGSLARLVLCIGVLLTGVPAQAADHFIGSSRSTVDGGSIAPGDTITLAAGNRGSIRFDGLSGTANNPILIRNDSNGTGPVVISGGSGFVFHCYDCRNVVIDGTGKWSGAPAGTCGVSDWPDTMGTNQCGIVVSGNGGATACLRMAGLSTDYVIRGVEIDGNGGGCGIGININDHNEKTGAHPGFWREDIRVEHNYVHDTGTEGMYIGPNHREGDIPLRNIGISYNFVRGSGWDCINLKSAFEGTNDIDHNYLIQCGNHNDTSAAQHKGIAVSDSSANVYNNIVIDAGEHGIHFRLFELPSGHGTKTANYYNNLVVRPGRTGPLTGIGIVVGRESSAPQVVGKVYNNTVVGSESDGIRVTNISSGEVKDNIVVDAGDAAVATGSGVVKTNNIIGTIAALGFVDRATDDYRLTAISPAVDSGMSNGAPNSDLTDLARPQGLAPDQGAFEFGSAIADESIPNPPSLVAVQ